MRPRSLLNWAVGLWLTLVTGLPSLAFDPPPDQGPAAEAMNEAPAWMVRVAVDRQDRAYVVGEDVNIQAVSEQAGYLYLFNIDTAGEKTLLFPNRFRPDNRIPAKSVISVPGPAGFRIRVGPRGLGTETLLAVVTKRPLQEMKPEEFSREGPTPLRGDPWPARRGRGVAGGPGRSPPVGSRGVRAEVAGVGRAQHPDSHRAQPGTRSAPASRAVRRRQPLCQPAADGSPTASLRAQGCRADGRSFAPGRPVRSRQPADRRRRHPGEDSGRVPGASRFHPAGGHGADLLVRARRAGED